MGDHECPKGQRYDPEKGECIDETPGESSTGEAGAMKSEDFVTKKDFEAFSTEVLEILGTLRKEEHDDDEEKDEKDKDDEDYSKAALAKLEAKIDAAMKPPEEDSGLAKLEKKLDEYLEFKKAAGAEAPGSPAANDKPSEAEKLLGEAKDRWDTSRGVA